MKEEILNIFNQTTDVKDRFIRENLDSLTGVIRVVTRALEEGKKVLLFGNGGSAADAQHIAAEFVNRFSMDRPPLPAISLVTDTSVLTGISNDYGFSEVFAKQIKALGSSGDIAMGLSTNGNSVNVLRGFEVAREIGLVTIALTGNNGGRMAEAADYALIVPSRQTPRIQEVHIIIAHVICEMVEHLLFKVSAE